MSATLEAAGLKAYNDAIRQSIDQIVDDLRRGLGAKLVAYLAGVTETRTVREWAEGTRSPIANAEQHLRLAHRIMTLIEQSEGAAVVPTWFQGMNPQLGDRSPARVLREDRDDRSRERVLAAAKAFVGT